MEELIRELYPICRSITGNGTRASLDAIGRRISLERYEVPSGTRAFDWTVPKEWNIRDAYVMDDSGKRVVDFRRSNLHVVNYSVPVRERMSLSELKKHLHSLPEHPAWIPYRTSYYREDWGFCLSHEQLSALKDGVYEVCIDSSLEKGHLSYAECYLPGQTEDEVLLSCHICHPSLCNDNLSGMALATAFAQALGRRPDRRFSYRFLFVPGTIGAILWLSRNLALLDRIRHGLVLAGVGDPGALTYKRSRRGDADIDRAAVHALEESGQDFEVVEFSPDGYDERQYCSPGFDLPVGRLSRTPPGRYREYHTSADSLDFVSADALAGSFDALARIVQMLENDRAYVNLNPHCEPQLGRRGLYRMLGGHQDSDATELAMLWVLNLSDGRHTLLDIAERSQLAFEQILRAAGMLEGQGLLKAKDETAPRTRDIEEAQTDAGADLNPSAGPPEQPTGGRR